MESPRANAGAGARNLGYWNTSKVTHRSSEINNENCSELARKFPILAAHWFSNDFEAAK